MCTWIALGLSAVTYVHQPKPHIRPQTCLGHGTVVLPLLCPRVAFCSAECRAIVTSGLWVAFSRRRGQHHFWAAVRSLPVLDSHPSRRPRPFASAQSDQANPYPRPKIPPGMQPIQRSEGRGEA